MTQNIQALVQRFNLMVSEDDHKVRRSMFYALAGAMETAITRAADGDDARAMAEARALAQGLFDIGASNLFLPPYCDDYLHVAHLLVTPGEVKDNALGFQGLDDILNLRIPQVPRGALN